MSKAIEIDAHEIWEMIDRCSGEDLKKIQVSALRSGAKVIYDQAKRNFASMLPAAVKGRGGRSTNSTHGSRPIYFSDHLIDAIRMYVREESDHTYFFTVHTMGTRGRTSGTYRARFFEQGTVPRRAKTGAYRGQLRPLNYFGSAVMAKEVDAIDKMQTVFTDKFIALANV